MPVVGKTYKDNRDYKEVINKARASKKPRLTIAEKRRLKQIKDDLYMDRVVKQGFS